MSTIFLYSTARLKNLNKGFKLCSTCTHSVIGRKLVNASFYHISNRKVNPWQDISSKKHCIYLLCNYVYLVRLELSSKQWKRRISCQKLSPSNFLADDLTFTFYFVSGKVSCKVQRIGKLIPGKMTKINGQPMFGLNFLFHFSYISEFMALYMIKHKFELI